MNSKKKNDLISCFSCNATTQVKKIWYIDADLIDLITKSNPLPICEGCLKQAGYK